MSTPKQHQTENRWDIAIAQAKSILGTMQEDNEPDWSDTCLRAGKEMEAGIRRYEQSWIALESRIARAILNAWDNPLPPTEQAETTAANPPNQAAK